MGNTIVYGPAWLHSCFSLVWVIEYIIHWFDEKNGIKHWASHEQNISQNSVEKSKKTPRNYKTMMFPQLRYFCTSHKHIYNLVIPQLFNTIQGAALTF